MVRSKIEALVVPIFRRYWLWTAIERPNASTTMMTKVQQPTNSSSVRGDWRGTEASSLQKVTLEERFQSMGQRIASRAQARLMVEWKKLENAKEGSLRSYGYRLAQAVLSREDPQESFLKSIPTGAVQVDIKYPCSFQERLVRRRLRLLVHQGHRRHRWRFFLWILALLPQLPLMLTPLPNITVYYTAYRVYSHYRASQGSKTLERGFAALDTAQLGALRDQLLRVQADRDLIYDAETWPARLIRKEKKYLDIFENMLELQRQHKLEMKLKDATLPDDEKAGIEEELAQLSNEEFTTGTRIGFSADTVLDSLLFHNENKSSNQPLEDDVALKVGKVFERPNLLEMIARARRRAVGSMFPARSDEWKVL